MGAQEAAEKLTLDRVVEDARRRLSTLLTGEGMLVGEVGAALGITRKFTVPLLEYFDSVQFTRRVAERRVLAHHR